MVGYGLRRRAILNPRSGIAFWSKSVDHKRVTYDVEVNHKAAKAILKLPRQDLERVSQKIDALAEEPRPPGVEKLSGTKNGFRVRSGDYRIVYTVDDTVRVVSVTRVAHRREVYRRL